MARQPFLTVSEAADQLGVQPQRVRALIAAGALPAQRVGRQYLLAPEDVEKRRLQGVADGRPLDSSTAWAVLCLAAAPAGEPGPWAAYLHRNTRWRIRHRLGDGPLVSTLPALAPRLRRRATGRAFRAHPSDLTRLLHDPRVVRTGVSAADDVGADILAPGVAEGYVRASHVDTLLNDYALEPSHQPNVLLRVVEGSWPFSPDTRVAPLAAIALDLLDARDERTHRAGRELLQRLDRGQA